MDPGQFRPHHLGVAVRDLESATLFYQTAFGFALLSGPFRDPIQKVSVCFVGAPGTLPIELVAPTGEDSPVHRYLSKDIGAYHICYEVNEIGPAISRLGEARCLVVSGPVAAVAFDGRRIAWLYAPNRQLIELLESPGDNGAAPAG